MSKGWKIAWGLLSSIFLLAVVAAGWVYLQIFPPFHTAAARGDVAFMQKWVSLLGDGVLESRKYPLKSSVALKPMGWACYGGNINSMRYLVSIGANLRDSKALDCLTLAGSYGRYKSMQNVLDEFDFDLNQPDETKSARFTYLSSISAGTCTDEAVEVMRKMLKRGADPNLLRDPKDPDSVRPLYYAITTNCSEKVEALLSFGADIQLPLVNGKKFPEVIKSTHPDYAHLMALYKQGQK